MSISVGAVSEKNYYMFNLDFCKDIKSTFDYTILTRKVVKEATSNTPRDPFSLASAM
jgi:hypothetical protein